MVCSIARRVLGKNGDCILEQRPQHWIRFLETRVVSLPVSLHNGAELFEALPLVGFNIKGVEEIDDQFIRDDFFPLSVNGRISSMSNRISRMSRRRA